MSTSTDSSRLPLQQVWPDTLVARYREAGHWRGETFPGSCASVQNAMPMTSRWSPATYA